MKIDLGFCRESIERIVARRGARRAGAAERRRHAEGEAHARQSASVRRHVEQRRIAGSSSQHGA